MADAQAAEPAAAVRAPGGATALSAPAGAPAPSVPAVGTRAEPPSHVGPVTGAPTGAPAPAGPAGTAPPRAQAPAPAITDPRVTPISSPSPTRDAVPASAGAATWAPPAAPKAPDSGPADPAADAGTEPAKASGSGTPAPASADDRRVPPVAAKVSVVKERVDVPDFGRITGARVAVLAVPVAGVVRVPRRKNVIGSETTGSIPVHLLFRDEPEAGATKPAVNGDDGGPDTVAMEVSAAPAKNGKAAIPAPAKTEQQAQKKATNRPGPKGQGQGQSPRQPRTQPQKHPHSHLQDPNQSRAAKARPAPTADPDLVERPGPALPGWVGVAGGALALAGCAAVVWWAGAVPAEAARMLRLPARPYNGIHLGQWALLALGVVATLFALGGLGRGRVGYAWVLTLFGDYRGTVRRTGLVWVSPLLLRRRVDVRLRHWRSEPLPAVDAKGTALDVTVLVVWRVRDTVRAALGVDGHEDYLREQVEAAMARVLSQLPADAFHEDAPTLRDAEAVGEALTRMLSAECAPVGVDVFSAQPTRIEYAPEVAAAMQRRRIAAIDAKHRDSVLTSVVDAVDDVVHRLTSRGLVELDDYERKALVKDLTVAFYTGRTAPAEGA
ncbi:SPFH domain-containing protein [Streptomyces sp. NPDC056747]|uniref:SPFH domain-containing protein n=1 Tax=Streptomyces sp. NPDC056747 TaxID=3345935 RepID=UPI0036BF2DC1